MKLNVPGPTSNIPYSVALLDSQGGARASVSTEKKSPQIRHLAAEKREQFRVRALGRCKGLRERADQVTHGLIYRAVFFSRWNNTRSFKTDPSVLTSATTRIRIWVSP